MKKPLFQPARAVGLIAATALLAALTGCTTGGSNQRIAHRPRPVVQVQATVVLQDDYDYYPGYEIYYSRNRHEYVYLDGREWVRRPEPRGVSVSVLFASPSVRLDFHDSPDRHHHRVVRSYPRHWAPPPKRHDNKDDRRDDRRDDRKDYQRKRPAGRPQE